MDPAGGFFAPPCAILLIKSGPEGRNLRGAYMKFQKIDKAHWTRSEYFQHYFSDVPCTYSITVKLDVTPIKERSIKLYPAMLYHLTTIVNRHAEFRTAINEAGDLGVYSNMHPAIRCFTKTQRHFPIRGRHIRRIWASSAPHTKPIFGNTVPGTVWSENPTSLPTPFPCPCCPGQSLTALT